MSDVAQHLATRFVLTRSVLRAMLLTQTQHEEAPMITAQEVRDVFEYSASSGRLIWRHRHRCLFSTRRGQSVWNANNAGKRAGSLNDEGYVMIKLGRKNYRAHVLIWLYVHGEYAPVLDHINGDRSDNRIHNLRSVTVAENNRNMRCRSDNTSGATGVYFLKDCGKWRAQIAVNGRDISLGRFSDFSAALAARKTAEKKFGFHPNHGRKAAE